MSGFTKGILLGGVLGLVIGAVLGSTLGGAPAGLSPARIDDLNRKIAAAEDARTRADKQLEHFQKVAEQMAESFQVLEHRFNALTQSGGAAEPTPTATN